MRVATAFLCLTFLVGSVSFADTTKELEKRLARLDDEIKKVEAADKTALGAARLEELREARAKLAASIRRSKLKEKPTAGTPALSDLDKLIEKARTGDAKARAQLVTLKGRIDKAVQTPAAAPGPVIMGGAFRGQIIMGANGAVMGLGGVRHAAPQPAPKQKEEPKKVEPRPVTEAELGEHEKRAAALEKQVVEMTRKVLELEERLKELRAKVAEVSER